MPAKNREYELTPALLIAYRDAALANAQSLLDDANVLITNGRFARGYFLSASCIEEAGKAVQAYEGLGRNLKDPAVSQRLKLQFDDHSQKVTAAFSPWIQASSDLESEVMDFVRTMIDLKFGREASMYTDIHPERSIVTTPQMQVKESTARNCYRLAQAVVTRVVPYATQQSPKTTTREQDAFFALKTTTFQRMANTADFWEYYISRMHQGESALEKAVISYNDLYFSKSKLFKPPTESPAD